MLWERIIKMDDVDLERSYEPLAEDVDLDNWVDLMAELYVEGKITALEYWKFIISL